MKQIITALNAAYKECGYVQKAGKNKEQGYKFAGEADFIEAIRPVLLAHGITVFPSAYELIKSEDYATKSGTRMNRIVAKYTFTFAHTSGEFISVVAVGEGADSSDKASPKAATIALKYALRQTLLIETGDDPDVVTPEPRVEIKQRPELTPEQKEEKAIEFAEKLVKSAPDLPEAIPGYRQENQDTIDRCMNYPKAKELLEKAGIA